MKESFFSMSLGWIERKRKKASFSVRLASCDGGVNFEKFFDENKSDGSSEFSENNCSLDVVFSAAKEI